ncbi:uncharacterized protein LOC114828516 [Galendromus occidentalis]|uniref:Uncharacterized protein LOC114828516 n=1 Tax=Galendromus occidentalis TaxID=34638 RepID=A0AAJ7WK19_9ACAR|nr:uncharacterized protein LOC114828516 [Galendromus occidentalis]
MVSTNVLCAVVLTLGFHLFAVPVLAKDASASSATAKKTEVWSIGIPNVGMVSPNLKVAASHPHEYYGYPHAAGYGGPAAGGYGGGHYAQPGYGGGHGYGHNEFEFGHVSPSYKTSLGCGHKGFDLIPWFLMALGAVMLIPLFGALVQFKLQALAPLFGFQGQTPLVTTQVGGTRTTLQARLLNEIWPVVDKAIEQYTGMATEELKKEALNAVNAINSGSKKSS